jgi:hypothetical protein
MIDSWCHSASIDVNCTPTAALEYLADGVKQGEWALGSINRESIGSDLYTGVSMFGNGRQYIRIRKDAENLMVHYSVGTAVDALRPLAVVRIVPGPVLNRPESSCVVTLLAWRPAGTPEDAWQRLAVSHETEMFIIQARLEGKA